MPQVLAITYIVMYVYLTVQEFVYYRPYLTINTFWLIFVVASIGLAIGTTLGVILLFAVQVSTYSRELVQLFLV